jgi:SAM-dependent methyltransferase
VDAILLANTYHELDNRGLVLSQAFRALRSGGRVVILDRGDGHGVTHHEVSLAAVETDLADRGFELIHRDARFIERAPAESWWLAVARKRK